MRAESKVNWGPLALAVLATAPALTLSLVLDAPHWLEAAVVTVCALVAQQRTMLTPAGTLLHGLTILVGFTLLSFALLVPPVFVIGTALFAAATIGLSAWGDTLRSVGTALPYLVAALAPVVILSAVEHLADRGNRRALRPKPRLTRTADLGPRRLVREAMVTTALAVGLTTLIVQWQAVGNGQWAIWSAASVVIVGDTTATPRRLRDRLTGAIIGVPLGIGRDW